MHTRRRLLQAGAAAVALAVPLLPQSAVRADEPMPVVATFSIIGDMVTRIGGKNVTVTTLVGPDGDAHVYQPTPADARAVSDAKVLIVNGLEFEGWLDRLVDASGFEGTQAVATAGVDAIPFGEDDHDAHDDDKHAGHGDDDHAGHDHDKHDDDKHAGHDHDKHSDDDHAGHDHGKHDEDKHAEHDHDKHGDDDHAGHDGHDHGAFDPHAWQSLSNGALYAKNIATTLAKADPANAETYKANAEAYIAEMQALDAEIKTMMAALPEKARTVVTSHDAFGYFAAAYGLTFEAPQGLSTESEASAADVAGIIEQIKSEGISAVFVETITDNRLLEQIARETGATIGGTLYSDALSGTDGPASTYLDMMRHNAMTLSSALGS